MNNPELIAQVDTIDSNGDEVSNQILIVGVGVRQNKDADINGTVDLDIRNYTKSRKCIIVRLPLQELLKAVGIAALCANRNI